LTARVLLSQMTDSAVLIINESATFKVPSISDTLFNFIERTLKIHYGSQSFDSSCS